MAMEFSSVRKLCLHLISSAYRRCRLSEQICRLSVILNRSSSSHQPLVRISISDTGIGSCLEEFQDLKFSSGDVAENWDGVLSVKTTSKFNALKLIKCRVIGRPFGINDNEIHNYQLNLKESGSSRRISKLPSDAKNGAKFSGTEVSMSSFVSLDLLLAEIHGFLQKNVAIELAAKDGDIPGSRYEKVFLANERKQSSLLASNLENLKSGFEDYVLKHGNSLNNNCNSCFPSWEYLKVGSGIACCVDNHLHTELVMEVVIVISDISKQNSPCFRECGAKTEVLYFKEFSPCTICQSSMKALKSIDWRRYGLSLVSMVQQDGFAVLEWENLRPDLHIDIVLHSYHKQTAIRSPRKNIQLENNLVKRAVKLSLDELKDKHAGILLSAHAVKIRDYAPDLAKTIAGLILSSNDLDFQGECLSLLGLHSQGVGTEILENSVKERIVSVIEMNDKKAQKTKEVAPFLFEDDCMQEVEFQDND